MNARRFALALVVAAISLSAAQEASAYYAAHMGRFTSRDPAGEVGRFGGGMPPSAGVAMGFVDRGRYGPMAAYDDGMNLYQYVRSTPTMMVDPHGLVTVAPPSGPILGPIIRPVVGGGAVGGPIGGVIGGICGVGTLLCYPYDDPKLGDWPGRETPEEQLKRCGLEYGACFIEATVQYMRCMDDPATDAMDCLEQKDDDLGKCIEDYNDCMKPDDRCKVTRA